MKTAFPATPASAIPVEDQAAEWFARMQSDQRDAGVCARFDAWIAQDAAHERAYRELEQLWCGLTPHGRSEQMRVLRADALADAERALCSRRRTRKLGFASAVAAGVAIFGLGALLTTRLLPLQEAHYQTAPGDRYTVILKDGSQVVLNTDTAVRVEFGWRTRAIVLERGQAHFKVAHAVVRPFEVDTGNGFVRALGTAFDVYRDGSDVRVMLVEGRIEVATQQPQIDSTAAALDKVLPSRAAILEPGQQVSITAAGLTPIRPADPVKETAWLNGRLVFDNERLQDAVSEVNRYSPVKLVIADREIGDMRISGVFRAGSAETFVSALRASYPIVTSPASEHVLLLARATDTARRERTAATP